MVGGASITGDLSMYMTAAVPVSLTCSLREKFRASWMSVTFASLATSPVPADKFTCDTHQVNEHLGRDMCSLHASLVT